MFFILDFALTFPRCLTGNLTLMFLFYFHGVTISPNISTFLIFFFHSPLRFSYHSFFSFVLFYSFLFCFAVSRISADGVTSSSRCVLHVSTGVGASQALVTTPEGDHIAAAMLSPEV